MWIHCQWGNEARLLLSLLERNLGLILSACVGSSLHIKWTVCISTRSGCEFTRVEAGGVETAVVAHISHRGHCGQLKGEKVALGGRDTSLFTCQGYTVSQNPVFSSFCFPFPSHIWQQSKLAFRGKAVVTSLGRMRFSSGKQVGSQQLCETLKISLHFQWQIVTSGVPWCARLFAGF